MKKFTAFLIFGVLTGTFVFGDDAVVLPQGVFRLRAIPSYTMLDQVYDKDGKSVDSIKGNVTVLSSALELGLTPAVTLGAQWAPGMVLANTFDRVPGSTTPGKVSILGLKDLQLGAKLQLVGATGFMVNDQIRFSVTPGVQLPLDTYDAKAEAKNLFDGKSFRGASSSQFQTLGFGAKADADYVISEMLFVNVHAEAKSFLPLEALAFETVVSNAIYAGLLGQAAADAAYPQTKTKTEYGLQATIEFEPHAKFALSGDTSVSVGVPFTYDMSGESKVTYNGASLTDDAANVLSVGPNASFFTVIGPLPVEVEVQYVMPLMGKLSSAGSTVSVQVKIFGKLF